MRHIAAVLAFFLVASPLQSQSRWVVIDSVNSIAIDMKTLKKGKQGTYLVWYEITYDQPIQGRDDEGNTYHIKTAKSQRLISCSTRKSILIKFVHYKKDGEVGSSHDLSSILNRSPPEWDEPIPDSIGEIMIDSACDYFSANRI